ncbi:hypothetical protein CLU88_0890 [Acidovorax sp. 56]|uniref:hypothetical protein n=1 Tax=Acidovorax sp. 56 TaxID=2035205 RepID=UPI000C43C06D|nr:hypothetical protein [Acidovorax sp. 56]PIF26052.1 hypothetical protein CLU88_0890 [Acidovorax sp. 56]
MTSLTSAMGPKLFRALQAINFDEKCCQRFLDERWLLSISKLVTWARALQSLHLNRPDGTLFPTVTLCPGFRNAGLAPLGGLAVVVLFSAAEVAVNMATARRFFGGPCFSLSIALSLYKTLGRMDAMMRLASAPSISIYPHPCH